MTKAILAALLGALSLGQALAQQRVDLPRGTAIQVRITERISAERNRSGDNFNVVLDEDLTDQGRALARQGDRVTGEIVRAEKDDGQMIELTLTELRSGNQTYSLDTNNVIVRTEDADNDDSGNKDATIIGGGAGLGAVIGAIAGGVKGAIIGAVVGAGAGATAVLVTRDDKVEFDPEQKFRFYLDRDVNDMRVLTSSTEIGRSGDDDRYERTGSLTDTDRSAVRGIAGELDQRADHVWSMVSDGSRFFETNSRTTSDDTTKLYLSLSNFADSTERYKRLADDSRYQQMLRAGAEHLIRQAEEVDSLLRTADSTGHIEDDWRQVQDSLSQLSSRFQLAYRPGQSRFGE